MLKKICRLFLGLVVCAGSACVTPTHASSASPVLLTIIQAAGQGGAKEELVSFYNTSTVDQDITGWCLQNKASIKFACLGNTSDTIRLMLPSYSGAVIASSEYVATSGVDPLQFTAVYSVTNQSSGSLVGSADTVTLLSASGAAVDSYSWSTSTATGKVWMRSQAGAGQASYASTGLPSDWQSTPLLFIPASEVFEVTIEAPVEPDPVEPNDDESQNVPDPELEDAGFHPYISEVLPNPAGSDTGQEFIELYNPNQSKDIALDRYVLRVGPTLEKSYAFPVGAILPALSYKAFTSTEINFTLVNTTSSLQLQHAGSATGEVVTYMSPADGSAWAFVDSGWLYVATPTPGSKNALPGDEAGLSQSGNDTGGESTDVPKVIVGTLKPCAPNQYRNLETNRCRLLQSASSAAPTPCKQGQVRNADTGRCRNITSESSSPSPCKDGQERNLETNRCRNTVKMTNANHAVMGASVQSANTGLSIYAWLAIAGVIALIVGYGVWEWRAEAKTLLRWLRQKFLRRST